MKTILTIKLFLFTLLLSPNFYCQEIEYSEVKDLVKKKTPIYYKYIGSNENETVYCEFKPGYSSISYHVENIKTGEVVESDFIKIKTEKTGYVSQFVMQGDYVYELCRFSSMVNSLKADFGLIKRSLKTFKQEGEILWFAKDFEILGSYYNLFDLTYNKDGFIVSTGIRTSEKNNCYIAHYDWDLNLKWTKDLNFLKQEGASIDKQLLQSDGQVILSIKFQNPEKGFTFKDKKIKSSILTFLVIDSSEEFLVISPEFNTNIVFTSYNVFYNFEKSELVSIFNITELTNPNKEKVNGSGIAYFKHSNEGELINSNLKMFTYKDILNEEILKSLSENKIKSPQSMTENYPNLDNDPSLRIKENGHFILSYGLNDKEELQNKVTEHLSKSVFYIELNENGEILWQKSIFRTTSEIGIRNSIVEGNNLMFITLESQELYDKKDFMNFNIDIDLDIPKTVWVYYMVDENGEILSSKILDLNPHDFSNDTWFTKVSNDPVKYKITFTDAKKTKSYSTTLTLN